MPGPSDNGPGHFLHPTHSLTRMESSESRPSLPSRQMSADQGDTTTPPTFTVDDGNQQTGPDVFERRGSADSGGGDGQADEGFVLSRSLTDPSEELPIELISLTDRYV